MAPGNGRVIRRKRQRLNGTAFDSYKILAWSRSLIVFNFDLPFVPGPMTPLKLC
jgi:hypothetical protein